MTRRVVVTGLGAVSPVGIGADPTWQALVAGVSGAGPITLFDATGFPVRIAAEVDGWDEVALFGKRRARHLDRFTQFALIATGEAITASGLDVTAVSDRAGVVYGSGIGGMATFESQVLVAAQRGPQWVSPYFCPMMIANAAAGEIAIEWGLRGHCSCTVTACAASAHAIGEAVDTIRLDRADVMIAGGSEAGITATGIAGFAATKALSERNDDPTRASRPFDLGRDGFVAGEGAATLILEERDRAVARGAPILAEVVGFGSTCDAHHMTAPHPEGDGAVRAMRQALAEAEAFGAGPLGYINAHGTSTPPNDRIETAAVRSVVGDEVPMSSTKSMTGHLLGAAGALEAFVCIQVLRTGVLPPTINLDEPDPACDLDYVPLHARNVKGGVETVMTNSFGFGGHNASLVFARDGGS